MADRLSWEHDVSPANWIVERIHPFATDVGSVVPEGFDAYARVLHPVVIDAGPPRRWRDIAEENGRIVHAEMQLHMINRPVGTPTPNPFDTLQGLETGSLPRSERETLVEILQRATATPERCWFCVWEGFGALDRQGVSERVEIPGRKYLLARDPIERALESFEPSPWDQSANLWWPEDRAWVVATEIDFNWTYVGASADVVAAICADPRLEALEASIDHGVTFDSDAPNAALDA